MFNLETKIKWKKGFARLKWTKDVKKLSHRWKKKILKLNNFYFKLSFLNLKVHKGFNQNTWQSLRFVQIKGKCTKYEIIKQYKLKIELFFRDTLFKKKTWTMSKGTIKKFFVIDSDLDFHVFNFNDDYFHFLYKWDMWISAEENKIRIISYRIKQNKNYQL